MQCEQLLNLLSRMAAAGDQQDAVATAVEHFIELLGEQGGCIVFEPFPHVLVARHEEVSTGTPVDLALHPELAIARADGELVLESIEERQARGVIGRDLIPAGFATVARLPLCAHDQHLGWLWACSRRPAGAIDEETTVAARTIGHMVALLVAQRQDEAQEAAPSRRDPPEERLPPVDRSVTPVWGTEIVGRTTRPRILLVEDHEDFATLLGDALAAEGYEVSTHHSGKEALASAHAMPPALALLDVHLPDGDGFTLALELASDRRTASVPVLFVSGDEALAARVRSFRAGEADFLRKPFPLQDLLARVDASLMRADRRNRLRRTARIDELTGLGNLRMLEERLAVEGSRLQRYGTPISVVVMDIDKLKAINDEHGHATGSAVLRAVGEALRREVRDTDLAVRYGGDEFTVLLPHTTLVDAVVFSERLLAHVRRLRPCGQVVSVSVGVAAFDSARDATLRELLERADGASYRAKREGGNRLCTDPAVPDVSIA
jgi:diguanylate cyclase (GGDEF)-like protein